MKKLRGIALILGVLILTLGIGYLAIAWTEPGQAPPAGNVSDPLNTSLTAQSKEGALVLATNSGVTTGLIVQYGKVGIGTTNPGQRLTIEGSAPIAEIRSGGYLMMRPTGNDWDMRLRADGAGASSYLSVYSGGDMVNPRMVVTAPGNVGIGTTNPGAKLEVAGTGKFTGAVDMTSQKITSLAGPTDAADAATKAYVDAQGAGGYLLETRCGWRTCSSSNIAVMGSCTPPSCPTGYTDRGTGCYPTSNAYGVSSQYSHSFYYDTACTQATQGTNSMSVVGLCYRWCEK
jgi:hypothetical protein